MELHPIGIVAFLAAAVMLVRGPGYAIATMAVLAVFGASAAVDFGGTNVLISYLGLAFLTLFVMRRVRIIPGVHLLSRTSAGFWMILFVIYALFSAFIFPSIFRNLPVYGFAAGADDYIRLTPLAPGMSNISQTMYLIAGMTTSVIVALFVVYMGRLREAVVGIFIAQGVLCGLGVIDFLNPPFKDVLFDFIRSASFRMLGDATIMDGGVIAGLPRIVGPHSEASAYAAAVIGFFGFSASYGLRTRHPAVLGAAGLSGVLIMLSTSSTAYGALILLGGFFGLYHLSQLFLKASGRSAIALYLCAMGAFMVVVLMWALGMIELFWAYFEAFLLDKAASDSGQERGDWNQQAVESFISTVGLGAGVGSMRASGLFFAILGTTGFFGVMAYLLHLRGIFTTKNTALPPRDRENVFDLKWGVLGILCAAAIANSSLNPNMTSYVMIGLVLGAGLLRQSGAREAIVRRGPGPQVQEIGSIHPPVTVR